ncbi:MAG: TonB family protein, partial [Muribaculum sp.]|nr:TonB family protein [Muribaculum sp.]
WALPAAIEQSAPERQTLNSVSVSNKSGLNPRIEIGTPIPINVIDEEPGKSFPWRECVNTAYIFGLAGGLIYLLVSAMHLIKVITAGNRNRREGYTEVVNDNVSGPFSWGHYIILRQTDFDRDLQMVLTHELRHIHRFHWVDILLCQINIILMWFNPAAYLYMRELRTIHEYEADNAIERKSQSLYRLMLIKKTVGTSFPTFANSLNHSQIYKRITMMMKNKSRKTRRFAALALPGAAVLSVMLLSQPSVAGVFGSLRETSPAVPQIADKVSQKPADMQIPVADVTVSEEGVVEQNNDAPSAMEEMIESVIAEENAPEQKEAISAGPAIFVNGKPFDKPLNDIEPAMIQSMTVVKDDPNYPTGKILIELKSDNEPMNAVEQVAEFKGGQKALFDYLGANIKYPETAIKNQVEGRVIVQFVVEKDGRITSPKVMKGVDADLDNEAIRLVKEMPAWTPACNNGEPVSSYFVLPVSFKLEK